MTPDMRKNPRKQTGYGWYNYGLLNGIERTRRAAVCEVERHVGAPWAKAKRYMEIHKVEVRKVKPVATKPLC